MHAHTHGTDQNKGWRRRMKEGGGQKPVYDVDARGGNLVGLTAAATMMTRSWPQKRNFPWKHRTGNSDAKNLMKLLAQFRAFKQKIRS